MVFHSYPRTPQPCDRLCVFVGGAETATLKASEAMTVNISYRFYHGSATADRRKVKVQPNGPASAKLCSPFPNIIQESRDLRQVATRVIVAHIASLRVIGQKVLQLGYCPLKILSFFFNKLCRSAHRCVSHTMSYNFLSSTEV